MIFYFVRKQILNGENFIVIIKAYKLMSFTMLLKWTKNAFKSALYPYDGKCELNEKFDFYNMK